MLCPTRAEMAMFSPSMGVNTRLLMEKAMRIDKEEWKQELERAENFYDIFSHLPKELRQELKKIKESFN